MCGKVQNCVEKCEKCVKIRGNLWTGCKEDIWCSIFDIFPKIRVALAAPSCYFTHCNYCNTLQHTATHCNTLQHAATKMQQVATHSNVQQHTATHCCPRDTFSLFIGRIRWMWDVCLRSAVCCSVLQHVAVCCSMLQCVAVCWCMHTVKAMCSMFCSIM